MSVLQLEAFEAPIKGKRLRWYLGHDHPIAYPPGFQEQIFTESPPFQRKILISSHNSSEAWKLVDRYDALFIPQTPMEWSLIIAFIQNIHHPCLVILTPEVQVPTAFYQKINQLGPKLPTLVVFSLLTSPIITPLIIFDATFFPPSKELESATEQVELILQSLVTTDILRMFVLKDAIRDLKVAGATLVVSTIEESKASLYWYYTSESNQQGKRLLETVIQTLLKRSV